MAGAFLVVALPRMVPLVPMLQDMMERRLALLVVLLEVVAFLAVADLVVEVERQRLHSPILF
jgi:hypothetical protein